MVDNQFNKTVIILSKNKVCQTAIAKRNKFFGKSVILNEMLCLEYKEIMVYKINVTHYMNYYLLVSPITYIFLLIKYLVEDEIFTQFVKRDIRTKIV